MTDEFGGVFTKEIPLDRLYDLIGKARVEDAAVDWVSTPIIDRCVKFAKASNKYKALIYVPAQNHDIWLFDEKVEGVAFPALLFGFVISDTVIVTRKVVAVKDFVLTEETELFHYPYSNVYEDAKACWDGLPNITEARQLATMPELFFGSPDTMHLGARNTSGLGYRELLVANQFKPFPSGILMARKETLHSFWESLN